MDSSSLGAVNSSSSTSGSSYSLSSSTSELSASAESDSVATGSGSIGSSINNECNNIYLKHHFVQPKEFEHSLD